MECIFSLSCCDGTLLCGANSSIESKPSLKDFCFSHFSKLIQHVSFMKTKQICLTIPNGSRPNRLFTLLPTIGYLAAFVLGEPSLLAIHSPISTPNINCTSCSSIRDRVLSTYVLSSGFNTLIGFLIQEILHKSLGDNSHRYLLPLPMDQTSMESVTARNSPKFKPSSFASSMSAKCLNLAPET